MSLSQFFLLSIGVFLAASVLLQSPWIVPVLAADYPNFVMILADDMGWGDTTYNNGTAYTPYLDAWSKNELHTITFHRGYSGSPVCSPTRSAAMTGRTPDRDCIYSANGCGSKPAYSCSEPYPLPNSTFTIAEAVKKASPDYQTVFIGKWHLGDFWQKEAKHLPSNPGMHGFDYWLATEASAPSCTPNCGCLPEWIESGCITGHYTNGPWCTNYWYANESSPINVSNYTSKIEGQDSVFIVDQFEGYMTTKMDFSKPFLVLLFLHPVHVEFLATDEWRESCLNGTSCPLITDGSSNYSSAQLDYFGDLSSTDVQINRIRTILQSSGVMDNTMLYFTSDNGPEGDGAGPFGSPTWPGSTNGLRGRKRDVWEGGIREPAIIQWNAVIPAQNFYSYFPIAVFDLLPTIMDVLSVQSSQPQWPIDGTSLYPMLMNGGQNSTRDRYMGWRFQGGIGYMENTVWKIVIDSHDCAKDECNPALYKLDSDPFETDNLTDKYPDIYANLMSNLIVWNASIDYSQYNESGCAYWHNSKFESEKL